MKKQKSVLEGRSAFCFFKESKNFCVLQMTKKCIHDLQKMPRAEKIKEEAEYREVWRVYLRIQISKVIRQVPAAA